MARICRHTDDNALECGLFKRRDAMLMHYKGYYGSIYMDLDDDILYGQVEYVEDLVSYEGNTLGDIKLAFEEAVGDYLDTSNKLEDYDNTRGN